MIDNTVKTTNAASVIGFGGLSLQHADDLLLGSFILMIVCVAGLMLTDERFSKPRVFFGAWLMGLGFLIFAISTQNQQILLAAPVASALICYRPSLLKDVITRFIGDKKNV